MKRDVVDGDREQVGPFGRKLDPVDLLADAPVRDDGLVASANVEHLNCARLKTKFKKD